METVLDRLPNAARVLVIRLRSLGDCVLTTPALDILKRARPDLKVATVVEGRFAPLFEGNPSVDCIMQPAVAAILRWRPQLCLNFHGGPRSIALTAVSRAPVRAGFAHFRASWLYNVRIPKAQEILAVQRKVHTAEHLASAMFYLGAPRQEIPCARLYAAVQSPVPPYAVLHPMASAPDKTWPAGSFLLVAEYLRFHWGLEPVFIAGTGEDLGFFGRYRTIAGASLSGVKSLLSSASLFVGNDSGPAHMAAAFGVPVVVLFGSSDPHIWGPWKTTSEVLTDEKGIAAVRVERVVEALERLRVKA
jgi:heptosyltransferase-3